MKLAAGVSGYQDVRGLERLRDTLPPKHVDYVFYIDGKYTELDAPNDFSTDGSREVFFKSSYNHVTVSSVAGSEVDKRNKYLELCRIYSVDYLLIIDSDEFVQPGADWKAFRANCERVCKDGDNVYGVEYYRHGGGGWDIIPRLWYKPGDMVYDRNHNIFKNTHTGQIQRSQASKALIEGIKLDSNDDMRTPEYVKLVYDYQVKLIAKEKRLEKEWRMKHREQGAHK